MNTVVRKTKRILLSLMILVASFAMVEQIDVVKVNAATYKDAVQVISEDVNVRATPSTNGKKLGKLQYGTYLNRYEERSDGWSSIDYGGSVAYVKSEYLSVVGTAGTTASVTQASANTETSEMVWLSATGKCYHSKNNCGSMNPSKARQVPLSDAKNGYKRCSKCW